MCHNLHVDWLAILLMFAAMLRRPGNKDALDENSALVGVPSYIPTHRDGALNTRQYFFCLLTREHQSLQCSLDVRSAHPISWLCPCQLVDAYALSQRGGVLRTQFMGRRT